MHDLKLIAASYQDLASISELAKLIWNQHYPAIISQTQIDYMLDKMYNLESLNEQLVKKKHQFFIIQLNKKHIGFISVNEENRNEWFLNKFYIDQTLSAKGIGREAWEELKKIIPAKQVRLTVNRQNFKSINFYFKVGFKIERVADFDIGKGFVMNDFVMIWQAT